MWKLAVPWLLAQLGVRKWLVERAFHLPQDVLPSACIEAGVTQEQWRAVEAEQARMVYGGIILRTQK